MSLFLIAHKVRGEAAFDIAQRCDDMGTPDDPGPWWIIPTSGHRAYPYWHEPLQTIEGDLGQDYLESILSMIPADLPDHYPAPRAHEPAPKINPRRLLETLGLAKPLIINRRL